MFEAGVEDNLFFASPVIPPLLLSVRDNVIRGG
jgi:hypothetical protein